MGPSENSSTLPLNAPPVVIPPAPPTTSVDIMSADDATAENHAPSRESLLMRAAELGPQRLTLDNIMGGSTDPVLAQKIQPRVAERRARFRTMVKVSLGALAGLCLIGTAATALSSTSSAPSTKAASAERAAVPAAAIVPVEKLELAVVTKAEKTAAPVPVAAAPAHAAPPAKAGRWAKRK